MRRPWFALLLIPIDIPDGTAEIRMPDDIRIRILAATAVREPKRLTPALPLYMRDPAEPAIAKETSR
jgi:hypothetical protein